MGQLTSYAVETGPRIRNSFVIGALAARSRSVWNISVYSGRRLGMYLISLQ